MIKVMCLKCQNIFEVPDSLAGQSETCPNCRAAVPIPASTPTPDTIAIANKLAHNEYGIVPEYRAVKALAAIYQLLGWGLLIAAICILLSASRRTGEHILMTVLLSVACALAAVFCFGFGQVLQCIRDIARNSFQ